MAGNLTVSCALDGQAPFGGHLLAVLQYLADGRLGLPNGLSEGCLGLQKVYRDPQSVNA